MEPKEIVDVVIPVCRPDERLVRILDALSEQTAAVRRIRLINTEKEWLVSSLAALQLTEQELLERWPKAEITHIRQTEFDHAATRARGFQLCEGAEFILTMTQDAVPVGDGLVEAMLQPFRVDELLAVSYARQLANPGATAEEKISREFNYPEQSRTKTQKDVAELGIKTYFCSDVCAMYRRKIWEKVGGFPAKAIFNEDMVFAGHALQAGYRIRYTAEACVQHSHSYTASQQFRRNFDLGVSQVQNPDVFRELSSEGEGMHYVKAVVRRLRQEHHAAQIPGFGVRCAARLLGYRMGKKYEKLPRGVILKCTSNRSYWSSGQNFSESKLSSKRWTF